MTIRTQTQTETANLLHLTLYIRREEPPVAPAIVVEPPPARVGHRLGTRNSVVRPPRSVSAAQRAVIAGNLGQRLIAGREARMQSFLVQVASMPGAEELKREYEAWAGDPIAQADALTTFVVETLDPRQHLPIIDSARMIVQMLVPSVRLDAFFQQCRIRLMRVNLNVEDRRRRNIVAQVYMEGLQTVDTEVNAHIEARYASIQERAKVWSQRARTATADTRLTLQILEQKIRDVQSRFLAQADEMKRAQEQQIGIEQLIGECEILLGGLT